MIPLTDMPGSNTILVMTSSERTSSQLREYLSTREAAKANTADDKPSQTAGKGMMERLLTTYFWWKGSLGEMARNSRGGVSKASTSQDGNNGAGPSQLRSVPASRGQPAFKRRRIRGGGSVGGSASTREDEKALAGDARDEGLEDEAETIADLSVVPLPSSHSIVNLHLAFSPFPKAFTPRLSRRTGRSRVLRAHPLLDDLSLQLPPSSTSRRWLARSLRLLVRSGKSLRCRRSGESSPRLPP